MTALTRRDLLRGVLRPDRAAAPVRTPAAEAPAPSGAGAAVTAWLRAPSCLAWQGSFCTVCAERCPAPGAIRLDAGRPVFAPAACTGCGVCRAVCPAPNVAILLLPVRGGAR